METTTRQKMRKHITHITLFSLVAVALAGVPAVSRAQDATNTNAPAIPAPTPVAPKNHVLPFRGQITTVNAAAMTFAIGTWVINVAPATKIVKNGKPGTFSDITVGEMASGAYKTDAIGNLEAVTVRLGEKDPMLKIKATEDQPPIIPGGN